MAGATDVTAEPAHPDLDGQQRWLDLAQEHLAAMQRRAAALAEVGARAVRQENTVEARIAQFHLQRRAPVAAAFYRATTVDPCGLSCRRRFVIEDRRVTALLDDPDAAPDGTPPRSIRPGGDTPVADRVGGGGLPGREVVALVTPAAVKGLEFDAVVVVDTPHRPA